MNKISSPCGETPGVRADEGLNKYGLDNSQRSRTEHSIRNRRGSTSSLAGFIKSDRLVPSCIQNFHSKSLLTEVILLPFKYTVMINVLYVEMSCMLLCNTQQHTFL
jgi:hypothetical protein